MGGSVDEQTAVWIGKRLRLAVLTSYSPESEDLSLFGET